MFVLSKGIYLLTRKRFNYIIIINGYECPFIKESFTLRVISGSARGLKLLSLPGTDTRPTLDRVKEALFSMIMGANIDTVALDLFAGSGALGIEHLSRGGKMCTFVDSSLDALNIVKANIEKARLGDLSKVIRADALEFIQNDTSHYDIIFLDPPYKLGLYEKVLGIIKQRGLLAENGIVALECDASGSIDCEGYTITKDKSYGKVRLLILEEAK